MPKRPPTLPVSLRPKGHDKSASQALTAQQAELGLRPVCNAVPWRAVTRHIGVDEAGRGCLAGPVVAAAVIFPSSFDFDALLPDLDDSKRLAARQRFELASRIPSLCLAHGVGLAWQDEIDNVNILQATFRAMSRAVLALARRLETLNEPKELPPLLVDGNHIIPAGQWTFCASGLPVSALAWEQYFPLPLSEQPQTAPLLPEQHAVVGGDALVPSISAASIIAKTVRDGILDRLDERFPLYGFARHKGYGTKEHLAAIAAHGPCLLHRMTFRGVGDEDTGRQAQASLF